MFYFNEDEELQEELLKESFNPYFTGCSTSTNSTR